jgi:hypothetical protein
MIGENPIKTNKAKAEDQIIIYYATNAAAARAVALVSLPTRRHTWSFDQNSFQIDWIKSCSTSKSCNFDCKILILFIFEH